MASSESPEGGGYSQPEHPDMDLLAQVMAEYLSPREGMSMEEALRVSLGTLVDPQSGSWVATQRATGFLGIKTPEEMQRRHQEVFRLGVFWLDGFIAGGHTERLRAGHDTGSDPGMQAP